MDDQQIIVVAGFCVIALAVIASSLVMLAFRPRRIPARISLKCPASETPATMLGDAWTTLIPATRREIFFPAPPHFPLVYQITVTGWISIGEPGDTRYYDALYRTDHDGNFTKPHDGLRLNGRALAKIPHILEAPDRLRHRYTFRVDGPRERLSIAFEGWGKAGLRAEVVALPPETPSVAKALMPVKDPPEKTEGAAAAQFAEEIRACCLKAEVLRNWEDEAFLRKYAEVHTGELLARRDEIRSQAMAFLNRHALVRYLRAHHPTVVRRHLGRLEALILAEQLDLEAKKVPVVLPRRPPTVEEVRERLRRRIEVAAADRRAMRAAILEQQRLELAMLDQFELTEDQREQQERDINDITAGELARLAEGRGEIINATGKTIG